MVLLVTSVAVGAAALYASNRTVPAYEGAVSPPSTGSASTATKAAPTTRQPVLAFYGDWYVSGTAQGGLGQAGWPAIVSTRIGAEESTPHAVPDAGYVTASTTTGDTFMSLVENSPESGADVTIAFGGRNDYRAAPAEITSAATRTFEAIRAAAPQTQLLVIGPAWTDQVVPPELPPIRDAVRTAATASGATFVDPLTDRWLFDGPDLLGDDGISPTDAGHAFLADRIEPVVRELLANVPGIETAAATPPP